MVLSISEKSQHRRWTKSVCQWFFSSKWTFFINSKLLFQKIVLLIEAWVTIWHQGFTQRSSWNFAEKQLLIGTSLYVKFLSDPFSEGERYPRRGSGLNVEIYESLLSKRKCRRVRVIQEKWVLEVLFRDQRIFIIPVARRSMDYLLPVYMKQLDVTQCHVLEWMAYMILSEPAFNPVIKS